MKQLLIIAIISVFTLPVFSQYILETPITGLNQPVDFAFIPNSTKVIVTHKLAYARIYDLTNNTLVSTFWTFTDSLNSNFERGVLGVCIDPNYSSNHYIYIYYVHSNPPNSSTNQRIRIVRFVENNNLGTAPFLVLDHPITNNPPGNHFGGIIRFRPSDPNKIYFAIGENANSSNAQLLTNPLGKMLRINKDGTIPTDNPFYDDGNPYSGNDDRIWSYGLRNSFGFCFSPVNDSLYESENGASTYDEANIIIKGKNYGWPICEGYCSPYNPLYKQPMVVFGPGTLPSLTGALVYNGSQMPWLNNKLLLASNNTNANSVINKCDFNATNDSVISKSTLLNLNQLTTLLQGSDGYIYAMNGGYTSTGKIYRIKPDPLAVINSNTPVAFNLEQNFPNPFNPSTNISYEIPRNNIVKLDIYNIIGQKIASLINEFQVAGKHNVNWNASEFPSGIYLCKLSSGDYSTDMKMTLLK